jgi:hypothetical protein
MQKSGRSMQRPYSGFKDYSVRPNQNSVWVVPMSPEAEG